MYDPWIGGSRKVVYEKVELFSRKAEDRVRTTLRLSIRRAADGDDVAQVRRRGHVATLSFGRFVLTGLLNCKLTVDGDRSSDLGGFVLQKGGFDGPQGASGCLRHGAQHHGRTSENERPENSSAVRSVSAFCRRSWMRMRDNSKGQCACANRRIAEIVEISSEMRNFGNGISASLGCSSKYK